MKFFYVVLTITAAFLSTSQGFTNIPRIQVKRGVFSLSSKVSVEDDNGCSNPLILSKAKACIHSDSCSLEDTLHYYSVLSTAVENVKNNNQELALALEYSDASQDIDLVLVELKKKLDRLEQDWLQRRTLAFGSPVFVVLLLMLYSSVTMARMADPLTVPFEFEEWKMAIQGGYLDTMIAHFVRNGGL